VPVAMFEKKRAGLSFAIASTAPFVTAWLHEAPAFSGTLIECLMLLIAYLIVLVVVSIVGAPLLLLTLRLRLRPIATSLVAGSLAGAILTVLTYGQGFLIEQLVQAVCAGLATTITAAIVYFGNPLTRPSK